MLFLRFVGLAIVGACAAEDDVDRSFGPIPTGDTPEFVEVGRYLGLWYEIASIPMGFQEACYNTTARYEAIDAATISVHNECNWGRANAEPPLSIDGTATVTDPVSNAKLVVDLGFEPAPYWIVDLGEAEPGEPYPWAAVSNDRRDSLWVLARTSRITDGRFETIYERLAQRGFDPERMLITPQQ